MILASGMVEKHADDVIEKCIRGILLVCHDPLEGGEEWIEDAELGVECRAKVCFTDQGILTTDSCIENTRESITE